MVTKAHFLEDSRSEVSYTFLDRDIPALQVVLNPCELARHLSRVLPQEWGTVRDVRLEVLQRHRRRRWTATIVLETSTGGHELIGKVYATDRRDVYEVTKQLSHAGFGPEAQFSIPEPLAYIPELNLLLQEKVEGESVTELFSTGSEHQRSRAAERCALWLAEFHLRAPLLGPVYRLTNERVQHWARRLVSPYRSLEAKTQLLARRLEEFASLFEPTKISACHGGYWHQQIILTPSRIATVDWDNHCIGDPARDVAKFIVELEQLALRTHGSLHTLDDTIEIFYRTYTDNSKFPVKKSLSLYKAAICLKRAKYHLRRNGGGPEQAEAMLEEGLSALEKVG